MRLVSQHPGVPTLHRSYNDVDQTMFVMDFVRGGPLLDQIVQRTTFTENDARATFHSALRTMNFMAKIGVVHRDLKVRCRGRLPVVLRRGLFVTRPWAARLGLVMAGGVHTRDSPALFACRARWHWTNRHVLVSHCALAVVALADTLFLRSRPPSPAPQPENLLVDEHSAKWPIKISDFGFSAKIQTDELLYEAFGTPYYTAPEVIWRRGYSCACDVWSLGVVLYIVLFGYPPFAQTENQALFRAIGRGRFSFPAHTRVSVDARDAVSRMLVVNPSERITAAELLRHRWFTQRPAASSPLPTDQLRTFNARRKMKGSFLGVTTTFHLWSLIGRPLYAARALASTVAEEGSDAEPKPEVEPVHVVPRVQATPSGTLVLPRGELPSGLTPSSVAEDGVAPTSTTTYESALAALSESVAEEGSPTRPGGPPRAHGGCAPAVGVDGATSTALVAPNSAVAVATPGVHHLDELLRADGGGGAHHVDELLRADGGGGAHAGAPAADAPAVEPTIPEDAAAGWESPRGAADSDSWSTGSSSAMDDDIGNTVRGEAGAPEPPPQPPVPPRKQAHFAPDLDDADGGSSSDTPDGGDSTSDTADGGHSSDAADESDVEYAEEDGSQLLSRRRSLLLGEVPAGSPVSHTPPSAELDRELRTLLTQAEADGVDDATCNPFFASDAEGVGDDADAVASAPLRRHRPVPLDGLNLGDVDSHAGGSVSLPATPFRPLGTSPPLRLAPPPSVDGGAGNVADGAPALATPPPPPPGGGGGDAWSPADGSGGDAWSPADGSGGDAWSPADGGPPGGGPSSSADDGPGRSRSDVLHVVRSEVQAVAVASLPQPTAIPPLPPPRRRRGLAPLNLSGIS